ncbi:MAG: hypothetical protein K0S74_1033 [Chlamydiales bacterium]|jgi:hypothetical protein|nr:hypothetical protein [Chlamydiales bacterium]
MNPIRRSSEEQYIGDYVSSTNNRNNNNTRIKDSITNKKTTSVQEKVLPKTKKQERYEKKHSPQNTFPKKMGTRIVSKGPPKTDLDYSLAVKNKNGDDVMPLDIDRTTSYKDFINALEATMNRETADNTVTRIQISGKNSIYSSELDGFDKSIVLLNTILAKVVNGPFHFGIDEEAYDEYKVKEKDFGIPQDKAEAKALLEKTLELYKPLKADMDSKRKLAIYKVYNFFAPAMDQNIKAYQKKIEDLIKSLEEAAK